MSRLKVGVVVESKWKKDLEFWCGGGSVLVLFPVFYDDSCSKRWVVERRCKEDGNKFC